MAERRRKIPTRRRGAQPSSSVDLLPRDASIDGWISDESRRLEFLTLFKEKPLQMQGVYYPDLVCVFHYNLKFGENIGYTKVKGVEINHS